MIPTKYYLPLSLFILGLVGVFATGSMADRYLSIEILGVGLVIMMYFDDSVE